MQNWKGMLCYWADWHLKCTSYIWVHSYCFLQDLSIRNSIKPKIFQCTVAKLSQDPVAVQMTWIQSLNVAMSSVLDGIFSQVGTFGSCSPGRIPVRNSSSASVNTVLADRSCSQTEFWSLLQKDRCEKFSDRSSQTGTFSTQMLSPINAGPQQNKCGGCQPSGANR